MILLCFSIGKLCCYEFFTEVAYLRRNLGTEVIYDVSKHEVFKGKLKECHYVLDDKFGFFSLRIHIDGEKSLLHNTSATFKTPTPAGLSANLTVCEARKIKPAVIPVPDQRPENGGENTETGEKMSGEQN